MVQMWFVILHLEASCPVPAIAVGHKFGVSKGSDVSGFLWGRAIFWRSKEGVAHCRVGLGDDHKNSKFFITNSGIGHRLCKIQF